MVALARLQICDELVDTWAWVAPEQERQPDVVAGAPVDAGDTPDIDEGTHAILAPIQAWTNSDYGSKISNSLRV
nr:hypothetical protein [Tanacetum cinerariifolium]